MAPPKTINVLIVDDDRATQRMLADALTKQGFTVTVERDGPVPGAAYMRNVVVKPELRKKGLGTMLLNQALQVARDMHRKTLALRVDPANAPAVSFYRKAGFTTVATVVSKKSGKLRLLMSREL